MDISTLISMLVGGYIGNKADQQTASETITPNQAIGNANNRYSDMQSMLNNVMSGNADNTDVANAKTGMVSQLGTKFSLPSYTNPFANNPNFGQPDADINAAWKNKLSSGSVMSSTGNDALNLALQNLRNRTAVRPRIGG